MADVVNESTPVAAPAPGVESPPLARRRPVPDVSRHRFAVAYLALAAIVGATVGLVVVFTTDHKSKQTIVTQQWSNWRPVTTGTLGVREIARHVGPRYVLADGHQLTGVISGPMTIPSPSGPLPITAIVVSSGRAGTGRERLDVTYPQTGVLYQLCGAGTTCSIPGASTLARGQAVRREALELALYTFHYLPDADQILVFLPPPPGATQNDPTFHRAVFLPRSTLSSVLAAPLKVSLPPEGKKIVPGGLPAGQARFVDALTASQTFHYDLQQAGDQSVLVLLSPLEV